MHAIEHLADKIQCVAFHLLDGHTHNTHNTKDVEENAHLSTI